MIAGAHERVSANVGRIIAAYVAAAGTTAEEAIDYLHGAVSRRGEILGSAVAIAVEIEERVTARLRPKPPGYKDAPQGADGVAEEAHAP